MVRVLASSAVDHWFEPRSGQTKDYSVIFVIASPPGTQSGQYVRVGRSVYQCVRMGRHVYPRTVVSVNYKNPTKLLVYFKGDLIIISLKINLFSPRYTRAIAELELNNNHSLTHNIYSLCFSCSRRLWAIKKMSKKIKIKKVTK